jgi:murein DD-endopeptidase MepM/ murein hydrolase activator NlpD
MRRPRTARWAGVVLSAVLTAGLVAAAAPSSADPADRKREVDSTIEELEHALEGTSAELAAAALSLQETQARLPQAQAELTQAQATLAEARAKDAELASRLAAAAESEAKAAQTLDAGAAEIDRTHRTIGQIASQAYRGGGLDAGLALALSAQSPADFATRYVMVDTALRSQSGALARLNEQQAVRANQEARLEAVRLEIDRLKQEAAANLEVARQAQADAAARKAEVEQLLASQRDALAVIEARKAEEMTRLDQLETERAALEAELRRIEEERKRREAEEAARRSRSKAAPPPAQSGGILSMPVNARISSHYGYRIHPIYQTRRLHGGTDFAADCGTPVRAAADGSVVRAGVNGGFGNQVVLHHGTLRPGRRVVLQPPVPVRGHGWLGLARRGDRLRRHHRDVDRLPPALRGVRQRVDGESDGLALTHGLDCLFAP